jgi:hypothetical protein
MKKLPIGIQTFSTIIEDNYCYVDKTPLIAKLADQGRFYFFSRPRRFGKSLLVDTIADAFLGKKERFKELFLENNWDWNKTNPVIRIDFAQGVLTSRLQLDTDIIEMLNINADIHGIDIQRSETHLAFAELIRKLSQQTGKQVVVLVDEYDKPILDNLNTPDTARELRDGLRNFYSVLKAQGAHLRFVLLTGVSKFSKVSLFSGLNNLQDISLDKRYGTLCGYTQEELESVFHNYLTDVDLDLLKRWYNGYSFLSKPVYNPFDILLYLDSRYFKPYWFETGTPTFLLDLLIQKKISIPVLENITAGEELLGSFDIDFIEPETLLFQAGYLTIIQKEHLFDQEYIYHLGFPNHEVKKSLTGSILNKCINDIRPLKGNQADLLKTLKSGRLDELKKIFHAFFASIPHEWYRKNTIAQYEGYYCSIVYCYFTALGLDVRVEESTNHGRLDMVVFFENKTYIIEFKVNELTTPARALDQIKQKKYHEKYPGKDTRLIGIEFSKEDRNITRFEWERLCD